VEIIHRIGLAADERDRDELAQYGVHIATGLAWFDFRESDESWPDLKAWIARRRPSDVVRTRFAEAEASAADWLAVVPEWQFGYPQPENDFGYRQVTYDLSEFCAACGAGLRQVAPFRLKGEPKWGRRGVLQLNWVFDEYFAKPEIWDAVFRPLGVESMLVLNRKGAVLSGVVQLVIRERVPVDVRNLPLTVCEVCGRPKYPVVTRGPTPGPIAQPEGHLVRSREWFGDGASAANEVIASQALRRAVVRARVRGITFEPTT